jgi:hypothetical protein
MRQVVVQQQPAALPSMQFLLEIEELAGLTQQLEPWRRDVYAPLIIEAGPGS